MNRRWISVNEAAEYLSLHHSSIRRKVARGEIPHCRVGKTLRIDLKKLTESMESQNQQQSEVIK